MDDQPVKVRIGFSLEASKLEHLTGQRELLYCQYNFEQVNESTELEYSITPNANITLKLFKYMNYDIY